MRRLTVVLLYLSLVLMYPARADETTGKGPRKDQKPAVKASAKAASFEGPPCVCIQYMLQDRPGTPYDLYYCLVYYEETCEDPEADMWVGAPTHTGQQCEVGDCEPLDYRARAAAFEGHGMALDESNAWGWVHAGLASAKAKGSKVDWKNDPQYHNFTSTITVMTVPLTVADPNKPGKTKTLYFGIQIDAATTITQANVKSIKPRPGRLLVKYKVKGEDREAIIWLK
jgi:hypothetical protein